ncbi:HupE/UreJ family protein [Fretibacter rubidus]|uniref:HupE/UreJ family protein n=1 Tax=Fretibacter rubidus TaxID=570162 RepID=UPI00352B1536
MAHEIRPGYLEVNEHVVTASDTTTFSYDLVWKAPIRMGVPLAVSPEFPTDCVLSSNVERKNSGNAVISRYGVSCDTTIRGSVISFNGLDATLTDVLVRFQPHAGKQQTLRATASTPFVTLAVKPSRWDVAQTYFILGVEHIWFGFDHLLFVLGLVLLITGARRIIETITAFTLAHSVTLIATTLGWVSLPIAPVEAVIALSIVFLATEIIAKHPNEDRFAERYPWIVAAAFGLLHGFGFASALSNIGMPEQDVPTALLTFNLGVEFGQLAFVAVLLIALFVIQKMKIRRFTEIAASYYIGALAMFWLIQRVI